jgi:hypothetical protein
MASREAPVQASRRVLSGESHAECSPDLPSGYAPQSTVFVLSKEEEEALRRDGPDAVAKIMARAEKEYLQADDATRAEAEKRYDRALSLGAMLPGRLSGVVPTPEETERLSQYRRESAKLLDQMKDLPAEEKRRRLAAVKEHYLRGRSE